MKREKEEVDKEAIDYLSGPIVRWTHDPDLASLQGSHITIDED
jgi:hypothetical protein